RVGPERVARRPEPARAAGERGHLAVARDLAVWDLRGRLEYAAGEALGQLPVNREVKRVAPAGEVLIELAPRPVELARHGEHARRDALGQLGQDCVLLLEIDVRGAHQPRGGRRGQRRPGRGVGSRIGDVEQSRRVGGESEFGWAGVGGRGGPSQLALQRFGLGHGVYSFLSRFRSSCTLRRAASSLVSITDAISAYAASATNRSASAVRCLSGSPATVDQISPSSGPVASVGGSAAPASGSPTGTGRRARERAWSIALRCAIVSTQLRRFEALRSSGYARSAA